MVGATSTQIMEFVCLAHANLYDKRIQLTSLASLGIRMTIIPSSQEACPQASASPPRTHLRTFAQRVRLKDSIADSQLHARALHTASMPSLIHSFIRRLVTSFADTQLLAYASHTARTLVADSQLLTHGILVYALALMRT
jgi:hypothetical protein